MWINGQHRPDWHCAFLPLDKSGDSSQPRHLCAVALGPWREALPSYQDAAWFTINDTSFTQPSVAAEVDVFPTLRPTFVSVTELIATINAGDTSA